MNPIYTYIGGIRTYHYLLECRLHGRDKIDKVDQLMNIYMVNYIYNCCCPVMMMMIIVSPSLIIVMMMIMHLLMILIEIISSVRYSIFLCCT